LFKNFKYWFFTFRDDSSDYELGDEFYSAEKPKKKQKKTRPLGSRKTGSMPIGARPKTAVAKKGKGVKKSKPLSTLQKRIKEENWDTRTATAYGLSPPKKEKPSPTKPKRTTQIEERIAANSAQRMRQRSIPSHVSKKIETTEKQLNEEVSKAFEEMAKILEHVDPPSNEEE
jgi:hypothetical protein